MSKRLTSEQLARNILDRFVRDLKKLASRAKEFDATADEERDTYYEDRRAVMHVLRILSALRGPDKHNEGSAQAKMDYTCVIRKAVLGDLSVIGGMVYGPGDPEALGRLRHGEGVPVLDEHYVNHLVAAAGALRALGYLP